MDKEITFIKQVERTAKRDAYQNVLSYLKNFTREQAIKIIELKEISHTAFLDTLPLQYDYSTQSLILKEQYDCKVE